MALRKLRARLTGTSDLLMHNGELADPLNPHSRRLKQISAKRVKTDQDYEDMAKIEFMGALYLDRNLHPCIPAKVLEGVILGRGGAARQKREGQQAAKGIFVDSSFPLEYDGPKDAEAMWQDSRFRLSAMVRVQANRILRVRPLIPAGWTADVEITFDDAAVNKEQLSGWLKTAGEEIGIMDWRPRYGRFSVELIK